MDITFSCTKCGQHIAVDEAGAGKLVECPKCKTPLEVPYMSQALEKASAPSVSAPPAPLPQKSIVSVPLTPPACATPPHPTPPPDNKCPFCGKTIWAQARICLSCLNDLMSTCTIANTLTAIAVLDFVGAVIAGFVVGNENLSLGWMVFVGGILSGIFVLGFAYALKYLHAIARRL